MFLISSRRLGVIQWCLTALLLFPSACAQCQDVWDQAGAGFGGDACESGEVSRGKILLDETASMAVYRCVGSTYSRATIYDRDDTNHWVLRGVESGRLSDLGDPKALSSDGTILALDRAVYKHDGGDWNRLGNEIFSVSSVYRQAAISGDGLTVAYLNDITDVTVYSYSVDRDQWETKGQTIPGNRLFAMSRDGTTVAVEQTGSVVSVYRWDGGNWQQIGDKFARIGAPNLAVDLSRDGNIIAIGNDQDPGPSKNSRLGEVVVYELLNDGWKQIGEAIEGNGSVGCRRFSDFFLFFAVEPFCIDQTGFSVALSAMGDRIAIGSSDRSGYIRVFEHAAGEWKQVGGDLYHNNVSQMVSISSDGATIAIAARWIAEAEVFDRKCLDGVTPRPTQAPYSPDSVCSFGPLCPFIGVAGETLYSVFSFVLNGVFSLGSEQETQTPAPGTIVNF